MASEIVAYYLLLELNLASKWPFYTIDLNTAQNGFKYTVLISIYFFDK